MMLSRLHHRLSVSGLLLLFSLVLCVLPGRAEEPVRKVQAAMPVELMAMMPLGREFKGVVIPSYSGNTIKSVLRADTVVRVNDEYLDLTNLTITVYSASGTPETVISMDLAAYYLARSEMVSKTPATIEQKQMTMSGDVMTFDTQSQSSTLKGNVKVVVNNVGRMAPEKGARQEPSGPENPGRASRADSPAPSATAADDEVPASIPIP